MHEAELRLVRVKADMDSISILVPLLFKRASFPFCRKDELLSVKTNDNVDSGKTN